MCIMKEVTNTVNSIFRAFKAFQVHHTLLSNETELVKYLVKSLSERLRILLVLVFIKAEVKVLFRII